MSAPADTAQLVDVSLLATALATLEESGCVFWACDGPRIEPLPMMTCHVCETVAKLRDRLGLQTDGWDHVPDEPERRLYPELAS